MPESHDTVDHVSDVVQEMRSDWKLPDTLLGGTRAMRSARRDYLPQEEKERELAYDNRLKRSVLFNAYKSALNDTSAKPFARPVTLNNDEALPEPLDLIADDVDGRGTKLTPWCREAFKWAIHYGIVFVFVDMPVRRVQTADGESRAMTLAEFRSQRVRPLWRVYKARDVLGWRTELDEVTGQERLTQVRLAEQATVEEGDYASKRVERVRVVDRDSYEVWQSDSNKRDADYELVEEGTHTFGEVPVFAFATMPGEMPFTAEPALNELAWMNLLHWQSQSDQRNILRFARTATLYALGFDREKIEQGFSLGPNQVLASENENAKVGFAEHSGKAIEAGENDLKRLEERMTMLALRPFVPTSGNVTATGKAIETSGNVTATGKAIDESRSHTLIESWVRGFESFVLSLYEASAKWIGAELPDDFSVSIASEFAIAMRTADDVASLIKMREKRMLTQMLTQATFLREIKARGLLNELLDVQAEIEELEREDPFEGGLPLPVAAQDDDDDIDDDDIDFEPGELEDDVDIEDED
jgi:hypothetical protein